MRALYETVIALTVKFEDIPRVAARERIELTKLTEGFWHLTVHFGFVQIPDIPRSLKARERTRLSNRPQRRDLLRRPRHRGLL